MSVLLPYQARWYADRDGLRVCEKSRRVGVTWTEAARQAWRAARGRSLGGGHCYYVSTSYRLGREYIAEVAGWAEVLGELAGWDADAAEAQAGEVRFASGHHVRAVTSNPAAMRGLGGSVVIDEAAHHNDLLALLKASASLGDWGGDLAVISTHNGAANPFNDLVDAVRTGQRSGSLHRIDLDTALAQGLYKRQCAVRGIPWTADSEAAWRAEKLRSWGAAEEYEVQPAEGVGVYLRRDLIEASLTRELPAPVRWTCTSDFVKRPDADREAALRVWMDAELRPLLARLPQAPVVWGGDFARSADGDLSSFVAVAEDVQLRKSAVGIIELRGVPYEEQWAVLRTALEATPKLTGVALDGTGNGNWLAERCVRAMGSLCTIVHMSAEWYAANLPRLRGLFEEHDIRLPADADVRDDLGQFVALPRLGLAPERRAGHDGRPRHGDTAVGLLLAVSRCTIIPPTPPDFRRVTRRPSGW